MNYYEGVPKAFYKSAVLLYWLRQMEQDENEFGLFALTVGAAVLFEFRVINYDEYRYFIEYYTAGQRCKLDEMELIEPDEV